MRAFTTRLGRSGDLAGWAALTVVYLVWGSTYLAIRIGVRGLPPLTLAGVRYLIAGLLLYPFAIRAGGTEARREDKPGRKQWLAVAVVAVLLPVCGNGGVTIAEQTLPSGVAAVLVATVPLWMVAFAWPIDRSRPTARTASGLAIGMAGVVVLAGLSGAVKPGGVLIVLFASAAWGLGSVLSHRLALPGRTMLATAMEMLVAGAVLLAAAAVHGDFSRIAWSHVSGSTWLALAYLIVPGSIIAFSAFGFALGRLPLTTVSTYAYVNPVVAVLLGAVILSEPLTGWEAVGSALVVVSVIVARRPRRDAAEEPDASEVSEVSEVSDELSQSTNSPSSSSDRGSNPDAAARV
ncbi:MAG TPA: EamA family transporter [Actinocrinis sp.]